MLPELTGSGTLRARRVFPATGSTMLRDTAVAFSGGVITYVGAIREGLPPPQVALGDVTVLPGFIDAHVHLSLPADRRSYEEVHRAPDEDLVRTGLDNARRHLACGVTTVRDNGARGQVAFTIRRTAAQMGGGTTGGRATVPMPRMLVSGRPLTPRRGHFHFCGGEADTPDEIRAAVRQLAREGADHIKLIASGGGTTGSSPHLCTYTIEQLRTAVDTAHELGLPTTAHCRSTESIHRAVSAGVDCLEHLDFLHPDPGRPDTISYRPAVVDRLGEAGTYLSMTLQCGGYDTLLELTGIQRTRPLQAAQAATLARLRTYFDNKLHVLHRLLADGLGEQVVISTDAGPADTRFGRFPLGLTLAVQAGMTPTQALLAATRTPATLCGLAHVSGSLRPGHSADLLVVGGDPTADIRHAMDIRAVVLAGRQWHEISTVGPPAP